MDPQSLLDDVMKPLYEKGFRFRSFQEETIMRIANSMISNPTGAILIDAPTGTGKSIISIVGSSLLNAMGHTGYILTSDLGLQTQYENDIDRLGFNIPSIKGLDNYDCLVNLQPISLGECRTKGSGRDIPCYSDCPYFSRRDNAAYSKTALLNYSYWLLQLNYVLEKQGAMAKFDKRNFCFFDEAHKVQDIVQGHFSPRISHRISETVSDYIDAYSADVSSVRNNSRDVRKEVDAICSATDPKDMIRSMASLKALLAEVKKTKDSFTQYCGRKWKFGEPVPAHIVRAQRNIDRISDTYCKIEDYLECLQDERDLVKISDRKDERTFSFKNLNESGLIKKTLLEKSGFKTFMSATLGNPESYAKFIGLEKWDYIEIDNQFDLEKSPIFFFRGYKLNWANREKNFPKVLEVCDKIIAKHSDDRGIVHSSSFLLANDIVNSSSASDRFITYSTSSEKEDAIQRFKESKNGVLIGPSLLEGLSFDDDLSRFQIFFKVPFPNVSDEFMKKLLEMYPEKYMAKTANNIIQGTGRSVRSMDDWAITYIIDSCFDQLLDVKHLPKSFIERVKVRRIA
jgi:Rad3-related DNA helicase